MKRLIFLFLIHSVMILSLQAQKISNYSYKLDNGINVKPERCWGHVWVDQSFSAASPADLANPLTLNLRTLGDISAGSSFRLMSGGKEVKAQGAKPGNYTVHVSYKLSGRPGTLSFDIENVEIRQGSKTILSVTLYDYQILIEETQGSQKGLAAFTSGVVRYKGNIEDGAASGVPVIYAKGIHDKPLVPDVPVANKSGKIKPGTYDVLLTFGTQSHPQKLWLENFTMKPDMSYKITVNLNAGVVAYAGINKDVRRLGLYPAGISAKFTGNVPPDRNTEIVNCENRASAYACPPGTYDVLLSLGDGSKFEWRKNIVVKTGSRTDIK